MTERLEKAERLAEEWLADARRKDKRTFIEHARNVRSIVGNQMKVDDEDILIVALFHDVLEVNDKVTEDVIEAEFGNRVANFVHILTRSPGNPREAWRRRLNRISAAPDKVQCIAAADKIDGLRGLEYLTSVEIFSYLLDTKDLIGALKRCSGVCWLRDAFHLAASHWEFQM